MKTFILATVAFFTGASLLLADSTWLTSVPQAEAKAQKESKLVLLDFTGSDWCSWCKKLDADVFSKPAFSRYASSNLVLVEVDFPSHKEQSAELKAANAALQSKYNVSGYPTLVLLSPSGKVLWTQEGYMEGGLSAVIAKLDEAKKK